MAVYIQPIPAFLLSVTGHSHLQNEVKYHSSGVFVPCIFLALMVVDVQV